MKRLRLLIACSALVIGVTIPLTASADAAERCFGHGHVEYTKNLHPLGYSERTVPLDNTVPGSGVFSSDLAFWGNTAVQGTYAGFRLIDVSAPSNRRRSSTGRSAPALRTPSATRAMSSSGATLSSGRGTPARRRQISYRVPFPTTDPARYDARRVLR